MFPGIRSLQHTYVYLVLFPLLSLLLELRGLRVCYFKKSNNDEFVRAEHDPCGEGSDKRKVFAELREPLCILFLCQFVDHDVVHWSDAKEYDYFKVCCVLSWNKPKSFLMLFAFYSSQTIFICGYR